MELWVIRHASTRWNEEGRYQGRTDLGLSVRGREEASQWTFARGLAFQSAWASSLRRARETAEILLPSLDLADSLQTTAALAEMGLGEWEGLPAAEAKASLSPALRKQDWLGLDHRAPGGESLRDVMLRLDPWLQVLPTGPGRTLVVSHKGTIQALFALATGWDALSKPRPRPRFPHLHRFTWDGKLSVLSLNESLGEP